MRAISLATAPYQVGLFQARLFQVPRYQAHSLLFFAAVKFDTNGQADQQTPLIFLIAHLDCPLLPAQASTDRVLEHCRA